MMVLEKTWKLFTGTIISRVLHTVENQLLWVRNEAMKFTTACFKNQDHYNLLQNQDHFSLLQNQDLFSALQNQDHYSTLQNQDHYSTLQNQDHYSALQKQDHNSTLQNQDHYSTLQNLVCLSNQTDWHAAGQCMHWEPCSLQFVNHHSVILSFFILKITILLQYIYILNQSL